MHMNGAPTKIRKAIEWLNGLITKSFLAEGVQMHLVMELLTITTSTSLLVHHFINKSKVHKLVNFANIFIICTPFVIIDQKLTPLSLLNGWFSTMSFKCQWSWLSLLLPYLMLENAIEILRWHMFLYNIWFCVKFWENFLFYLSTPTVGKLLMKLASG